ncbi:UNVERIFIED_CONTAM: hypothetical protein ABID98_004186 [Brevibacillus sp. OAP136]
MSNVGLLYVGGVLFLNSIMLLGKVEGKSAGIFNLFVGVLQVITPLYLIMTAKGDTDVIFGASGIFLFGFTYLYVGITNLCKLDTSGVGWYSLWVAILAVGYSLVNFIQFGDYKFGIIWLMWAFLWMLFFILLGLKKEIGRYTGLVTLIQSWVTAAIPRFSFADRTVGQSLARIGLDRYGCQRHRVRLFLFHGGPCLPFAREPYSFCLKNSRCMPKPALPFAKRRFFSTWRSLPLLAVLKLNIASLTCYYPVRMMTGTYLL